MKRGKCLSLDQIICSKYVHNGMRLYARMLRTLHIKYTVRYIVRNILWKLFYAE